MEDKITEILQLERDNNRMLKQIILYLTNKSLNSNKEEFNDFMRNVAADLFTTNITRN